MSAASAGDPVLKRRPNHASDVKVVSRGTASTDAWIYWVSARTGRPGTCVLQMGEIV